jgi:hypothetical protein
MIGTGVEGVGRQRWPMAGLPGPFGSSAADAEAFDDYDEFVPAHLPEPGPFLAEHDVLTGREHAAFHRLTRAVFEERGVYDMTFGYNLARLNLDPRHPDAGFRYAAEGEGVLRAEFTPTTDFCPQSDTLTTGAFRAWNGLRDRHEYDLVRVRVADSHHRAAEINRTLERLERQFRESGVVPGAEQEGHTGGRIDGEAAESGGPSTSPF